MGNIVVDLHQDFECSALTKAELEAHDHGSGTWTPTTGSGRLSLRAGAEKTYPGTIGGNSDASGAQGLAYNCSGAQVAGYVQCEFTASAAFSIGFWFRAPSGWVGNYGEHDIYMSNNNMGVRNLFIKAENFQAPSEIRLHIFTPDELYSSGIAITGNSWYWLTSKFTKNATYQFRVYNDALSQVGSELTRIAPDYNIPLCCLGSFIGGTTSFTGYLDFDDFVMDLSTAVFPLLPSTSDSPPIGTPVLSVR